MSQFAHMSTGTESLYCVYCTLQQRALEIKELKKTVRTLVSDMAKTSSGDSADLSARPVSNITTTSKSPAANPPQHSNNTSHNKYKPKHPTSSDIESPIRHEDRKLNLVVFGIDESPSNTPRLDHLKNDLDHLVATFNSNEIPIEVHTIKDFHRLGKYSPTQSRPRPILVKFLRTIDVATILSHRGTLKAPLFIKQRDGNLSRLDTTARVLK